MEVRLTRAKDIFYIIMLAIVLFITGYELNLLRAELLVRKIKVNGIDYDAFRELKLDEQSLMRAKSKAEHLVKSYPELSTYSYVDAVGLITFSMLTNDYDLLEGSIIDEKTFLRGIVRVAQTHCFRELYGYYKALLYDLKYFPVPKVQQGKADISYIDSWYVLRSYGGNRRHEGTDLMASNNLRGYFPVISITEGEVENLGWLEKGGNRIGIRSDSGGYFYYAHLSSYAPGLKEGDRVIAGQLIGFMGDSGYGSEGTTGQFDVHLHLGMYVQAGVYDMSVNPYHILKILEKSRTQYSYQ
ncbi:MAG TPA: M23 family metallopeptidase [Mobilitalea sp.]|nr:M23 family metallopeptidase [Mobilitalea sp.]